MEKQIVPTICKGDKPAYSGSVTLKMPNYDQRMAMYEATGLEDAANVKNVSLVRSLAKMLPDFLVKVDITRIEDGYRFDTWDALQYDTDMAGVISDCCLALIGKYQVGKSTPPS